DIIEPLGHKAKQHNEQFLKKKDQVINSFTKQFLIDFCDGGQINWKRLVQFNSGNLDLTI
ncbi:MAG: cytosolic protein, partial [bacterium]